MILASSLLRRNGKRCSLLDEFNSIREILRVNFRCDGDSFFQTPVQGGRVGERRASSPFQNGQTEVLIGEVEGGPRSPRGSTSSAVNDANFLGPPDERDGNKPICRRVTTKSFVSFLFQTFIFILTSKSNQHEFHQYSKRVASVCVSSFVIINSRGEREIGEKTRESIAVPYNLYRVAPMRPMLPRRCSENSAGYC